VPRPAHLNRRLFVLLLALCACVSSAIAQQAAPTPPAALLARDYTDAIDPRDYWVSEKLDGVRALWDGKLLHFRSGRVIHAPAWFTAGFPAHALDGELWMGRRLFDETSAAVRREEPLDAEWRRISYRIFELPNGAGTFTERLAALRASIDRSGVPWLVLIEQFRVPDRKSLKTHLDAVVRSGGEGLMLHRADAPWEAGRSDTLLKMKPLHDAEARVIAHLPGKGKYQGMVGSLLVETPDGLRFRLGSGLTDAERRNPPPIGSIVTYRYRERTANGMPRFASFWRMREEE